MFIATIQMNSRGNKEKNVQKAEKFIDEAAGKGVKVVALPELFNFLGPDEEILSNAENIPGPTIDRIRNKATRYGIYILCGSILEKSTGLDKAFNTSVLVDPQGKIIARYRKIHLFNLEIKGGPLYKESTFVQPGREIVTVDTKLTKFGLSICYDLRFPEIYRKLTFNGARVIFVPAAFTLHTGKDHWESLIRTRAIENQVYIVAPDQIGPYLPGKENYGKSMIVDPWGIVMAKASDKEMVIYSELDIAHQDEIRKALPALLNRRKDIFPY
ncbi:Deaminated glutathione amidase [subsurface metagenome]|nr:carbon-nitrogen hydrolase family protein [Clostridia bacterium]